MAVFVSIENQNLIVIKGATKVCSSTQSQAVVQSGDTTITISGSDMEVKKLDLDGKEVCFAGKITNVKFSSKADKQPLLKRIFK